MREEYCDAGRGNIYVDILQGVAHGCTLSPNLFKVYNNDMIVAGSHGGGRYGGGGYNVGIDVCG